MKQGRQKKPIDELKSRLVQLCVTQQDSDKIDGAIESMMSGTTVTRSEALHEMLFAWFRERRRGETALHLFLLKALDETEGLDYEILVWAIDETQARQVCESSKKFEYLAGVWTDPKCSSCEHVVVPSEPGIFRVTV